MALEKKTFQTECDGKIVQLEISNLGEQANATVFGYYGQTVVMATTVMGKEDRDIDYMPLTVDYEEKFYAIGKILGSQYVRREGRASEGAILSGRLIDRTIRPLFQQGLRRDIQVVVTVLALDPDYDPHFIGLLTASTALAISDIPWGGPVAGLTIARLSDGTTIINPATEVLKNGFGFDLFAAGTKDKINMIELEGRDAQEKEIVQALERVQSEISRLIDFQTTVVQSIGQKKADVQLHEPAERIKKAVADFVSPKLENALYTATKMIRQNNVYQLETALLEYLQETGFAEEELSAAKKVMEELIDAFVHKNILTAEKRPDFRKLDEVRGLYSEVGLLKRVHGSALFIRGNTQSLALTTLGPPDDEQAVQTMEFSGKKRFFLHYNFPPYATGETGSFRGPGRREVGHGALAEKALRNLIPAKEEFPYTIRLVSEILSSNGSSSMASVCAGCLSLMDAGVPIKKIAAGIAMGLIMGENGDYKILTDIQGPEDHYGDMDFKVAGTKDGVTAAQMDVKIQGVTPTLIGEVLEQGKKARWQIIESMEKVLAKPRPQLSPFAPVVYSTKVNPEKIGAIIGGGGKTINNIIAQTGAAGIDIDQSGQVYIYASSQAAAKAALESVEAIAHEYKSGEVIEGTVVKILDFGAIVEFGFETDGMIHISELKNGYVKKVEDVVRIGDRVRAKILRVEDGRISLSLKDLGENR